jgi:AraC-like DNA-binding protein
VQSELKLMDDIWHIRLHKVEEAFYDAIELKQMMFPYWVVSYVAQGEVEVEDGGKLQLARSGHIMLHAPGVPFGEKATTPGRHLWMMLEVTNSDQVDLFRIYPVAEVQTLKTPKVYEDLFMQLLAVWKRSDSPFRAIQLSGVGLQLVHHLLENWEQTGRSRRTMIRPRNEERLEAVMAYIQASLHEKITRATLAALVHLNPNYVDKLFYDKYQMNPMQMLRELRLKKAKSLLASSSISLAEVAVACGLGDASYLSHQFAKRYGMNPGQYREQVRGANQAYYDMGKKSR